MESQGGRPAAAGCPPCASPRLEVDAGVECHQALSVSDHRGDAAESRAVDVRVRIAPLRLVEDVNHISPKCEGFALRDSNRLGESRIKAEHSRSSDRGR